MISMIHVVHSHYLEIWCFCFYWFLFCFSVHGTSIQLISDGSPTEQQYLFRNSSKLWTYALMYFFLSMFFLFLSAWKFNSINKWWFAQRTVILVQICTKAIDIVTRDILDFWCSQLHKSHFTHIMLKRKVGSLKCYQTCPIELAMMVARLQFYQ